MRTLHFLNLLAFVAVTSFLPLSAKAQQAYTLSDTGTAAIPTSTTSMTELEQRLAALEAAVKKDEQDEDDGWEDVSQEKWKNKFGGRIMGDWVNWIDQSPGVGGQSYFEFRRLRLFASGSGYGVYNYKFQVDFEPENSINITDSNGDTATVLNTDGVAIKDMWVGIKEVPLLGHVKFGHFKAPFSLEELTSSRYITFMERSLPNVFAPGREVGVAAFSHTADQNITWGYGLFFDGISEVAKERVDQNQGATFASRVTWTPYYDEPSDGRYLVHTGFNYRFTNPQNGMARFRARPEIHEGPTFIDTGVLANISDYQIAGAELAIVRGPFSIQSELMWNRVNQPGTNPDLYAFYLYGSYFLTGESRAYKRSSGTFDRVKPFENFWIVPGCVGKGAWELTTRWSYLDFSDAGGQQLNDVTFGVNWYWNPNVRMMFNWIHPINNPVGQEADIAAIRLQVDF